MGIIPTPVPRWPFTRVAPPLNQTPFERFRAAYPAFCERLVLDKKRCVLQLGLLGQMSLGEQRDHIRKLLRDRKLHRLYAYHAIRQARRLGNATPETVDALATSFNAFAPVTGERVALRWIEKGSGKRWVHDFGLRRRMQQKLVADILRQIHPPRRTQMLFNGGMPEARKAIATAYHEDGFTHGVELDFVGFYNSVERPALAELLRPLPTPVVEHVIWDVAMRDDPSLYAVVGTMPAPTSSVPTGLFLGSSTSPIVGEKVVARLLANAGEQDTITYADNLFVMGRSETEVRERIDRIRESAASLDVGSLELREGHSSRYNLTRPFEFLKQDGVATAAGFEWRPGTAKQLQYQIGAAEYDVSTDEIATAEKRVRFWRRSYPDWPEGNVQEAVHLAELATRRFYKDGNASNQTAAVHAIFVAWLADGQMRSLLEFIPEEGDRFLNRRKELIIAVARWEEARHALVAA
jgi:hypothetical protein